MKPQETQPSSFTFFYPIEDPHFIQYLENYCLNLEKKEKQIMENTKNWALFMEEDMADATQNGFSTNISRPSFNCFDFKDYVGSIENIPRYSFVKQQTQSLSKNEAECKIKEECQKENKTSFNEDQRRKNGVNFQRQNIKSQNLGSNEARNERREKRLNEIMLGVGLVQKEILKLMEDFES